MAASAKAATQTLCGDLKMMPTRCSSQSGDTMSAKRLMVWLWKVLVTSRSKFFSCLMLFILCMQSNIGAIVGKSYLKWRWSFRSYKLEIKEM